MRNPLDPRHLRRQKIVEDLFKLEFHKQKIGQDASRIVKNLKKIDKLIEKSAPAFPTEKINKVDLAILRLGVYELIIEKSQPSSVIIDEAIELAKEYGGQTSPGFINGVLAKLIKNDKHTSV